MVSRPVTSQTTRSQPGAPTCWEIVDETMKMPEPIIEPATSMVASSRPSPRTRPVALSSTAVAEFDILISPGTHLSQNPTQKHPRPFRPGLIDDLARRALFDDL